MPDRHVFMIHLKHTFSKEEPFLQSFSSNTEAFFWRNVSSVLLHGHWCRKGCFSRPVRDLVLSFGTILFYSPTVLPGVRRASLTVYIAAVSLLEGGWIFTCMERAWRTVVWFWSSVLYCLYSRKHLLLFFLKSWSGRFKISRKNESKCVMSVTHFKSYYEILKECFHCTTCIAMCICSNIPPHNIVSPVEKEIINLLTEVIWHFSRISGNAKQVGHKFN